MTTKFTFQLYEKFIYLEGMTTVTFGGAVEIGTGEATLKGDIEYLYAKEQINEGFVFNGKIVPPTKCMNHCGRYITIDSYVNDTTTGRIFACGNYKILGVSKINRVNSSAAANHCGNPCLPKPDIPGIMQLTGTDSRYGFTTEIVQLKCDPNCRGQCLVDMYVKFVEELYGSVNRCHECDRIIYSRIPRSKISPLAISEQAQKCASFVYEPIYCLQYMKGELDDLPCTSCENLDALDENNVLMGLSETIRDHRVEEREDLLGSFGFQEDLHKCEDTCRGECCINAIEEWLASDMKKSSNKR